MTSTPSGERLHITLFGIRNAGKSSLINAIAGRTISIVSEQPGTTTDPVSRPMELGGLGAVILTDTAGLDDVGELGELRVGRSLERLSWTDLALLVTPLHSPPSPIERKSLEEILDSGKPVVVVGSFSDGEIDDEKLLWLESLADIDDEEARPLIIARASGKTGEGVAELRNALAALPVGTHAGRPGAGGAASTSAGIALQKEAGPLEGLVDPGDLVVLVTPIDSAAPRGRLILPEAATLRDALDRGCPTLVVREHELAAAWPMLARKPRLVVTDSQAFAKVVESIPEDQPLTSFSILFARKKGELARFATGLEYVERLEEEGRRLGAAAADLPPVRLLALEACTHNRTHEDIATVKIPAALAKRTGRRVEPGVVRELSDLPPEGGFDLVVTCGGCMATRGRMEAQLDALEAAGLPVLNFGIFLGWASGAFPRVLEPLGAGEGIPAERALVEAPGA